MGSAVCEVIEPQVSIEAKQRGSGSSLLNTSRAEDEVLCVYQNCRARIKTQTPRTKSCGTAANLGTTFSFDDLKDGGEIFSTSARLIGSMPDRARLVDDRHRNA